MLLPAAASQQPQVHTLSLNQTEAPRLPAHLAGAARTRPARAHAGHWRGSTARTRPGRRTPCGSWWGCLGRADGGISHRCRGGCVPPAAWGSQCHTLWLQVGVPWVHQTCRAGPYALQQTASLCDPSLLPFLPWGSSPPPPHPGQAFTPTRTNRCPRRSHAHAPPAVQPPAAIGRRLRPTPAPRYDTCTFVINYGPAVSPAAGPRAAGGRAAPGSRPR